MIHGAWHDGRAWDEAAEHLRAAGYKVHTPTVAGHGRCGDRTTTLDKAVDSIVDSIETHNLADVALMGHSLGGVYVSQTAPRIAARLSRVVFETAFVLTDGESLYDMLPEALRENLQNSTHADGTVPPDYAFVRNGFLPTADDGTAREVFAELSPQGDGTFRVRVDQTGFDSLVADGEGDSPVADRVAVVGADVEAAILKADGLTRVDKSRDKTALCNAEIGKLRQFPVYLSNVIQPHEAFLFHKTAFVFALRSPIVPDGAHFGKAIRSRPAARQDARDHRPEDIHSRGQDLNARTDHHGGVGTGPKEGHRVTGEVLSLLADIDELESGSPSTRLSAPSSTLRDSPPRTSVTTNPASVGRARPGCTSPRANARRLSS